MPLQVGIDGRKNYSWKGPKKPRPSDYKFPLYNVEDNKLIQFVLQRIRPS